MADSTTAPGTEGEAPKAGESAEAPKTSETKTPEAKPAVEFDGPYDEDRAKRKIEAQKADLDKARARIAEYEKADNERQQAEMSDLQKAVARAEAAEKALAEREATDLKAKIAADADIPVELLTATTEDELKAQAATISALLGDRKPKTPAPGAKPKPKLSPASGGDAPESIDHAAIAQRIRRR
ncbi:hypothetical protein HPO96_36955 [Kribbella sandramycini]|uniref:Scaffolding protein n=1 Tax=Kribbella sandramycini TaxID=60450 RepID=A0A7Y4L7J6_9ACTN|nr:hypothetical protein [Kribbella sandramycini]MBB6564386.1 hypothetical protein [Kribbella sandramycini]NOL45849.1 hypothetical protein [Kribbella sandramycini]